MESIYINVSFSAAADYLFHENISSIKKNTNVSSKEENQIYVLV
jgi:hypothetical protein